MKLRIRPALFSDLASSYRLTQSSRASSSTSTSTSTSTRKPGRPRRPDIPDELREQGIAPEIVLTSTTGGAPTKSYRPAPAWVVHSNGEEPHLRANPWADTYKIDNSEIEADFDDSPQGALDRGAKMPDQVFDTSGTETRQSAEDHGTRRERYRPHSFGLSSSRASSSRGQGQSGSGKWTMERAVRRAEEDAQNSFAGEGLVERLRSSPAPLNHYDRTRSLPELPPSEQSLVEESATQEPDDSGENTSPQSVPQLSRRQESYAETADGAERRIIRFQTTEVDLKHRHLVYHHGDDADDKQWYSGSQVEISYYSLRDACPCPRCIDPSTRQRYHTSPEAYQEINGSAFRTGIPDQSMIQYRKTREGEGLQIVWAPDHTAFFPLSRLKDIAVPGSALANRLPSYGKRRLWTRKTLETSEHLHIQYEDLNNLDNRDQTLFYTLRQLHAYGIVVIKGVPTEKTGNEDCSLREVMGLIGEIRNTFYGETWNVRNVANSKNVAYTDVNLGLHADLLYFSSPPRFQALHCLRNRVEGGSSYFVDAFSAVLNLVRENPNFVVPIVDFEYDNDGHYLHYAHPLFTGPGDEFGRLNTAVNWSPPFQGLPRTATRKGGRSETEWFRSLDLFQKALERQKEWEFTLEEGDLVLFDNRRVLHARRAFRDLTEAEREERGVKIVEGESSRWLKGCYLDGEVVWDKLAVLHRQLHGSR